VADGTSGPDFKTIADFRRVNGLAIGNVCWRFVELYRGLRLFSGDTVAMDGSKFNAVNSRDKNYTAAKIDKRQQRSGVTSQASRGASDAHGLCVVPLGTLLGTGTRRL